MRGVLSWFAMILLFSVAVAVPRPAAAQESDNVEPKAGAPGTRFAFVAFGFNANEGVGAWVNTPGGMAMAITPENLGTANGDGRADWYWTTPSNAQPGIWTMVARGIDSNVERVISFEIRSEGTPAPAPAPDPTMMTGNVEPKAGAPGTRFAFVAFGFNANEGIGVWANTPGGTAIAITPEELGTANGDGRADWYWTTPGNAQTGIWTIVARGFDSGIERVISFEIR